MILTANKDGQMSSEIRATTLAIYECEPIGTDGTLEAVHVRWFCSSECRDKWPKDPAFKYGVDDEWIEGTVCDECRRRLTC